MELIAEQKYYKVERHVNSIEQIDIEQERTLLLYEDKIITKHRTFPIQEIIDVSYRKLGEEGGLLYLHTEHGVYSYTVKTSPQCFVDCCKQHLNKTK